MSDLNAKARNKLPKSDFGMPGSRAYPMPDAAHARDAKARASEEEAKGKLSKSSEEKIDSKANRVLAHSRPAASIGRNTSSNSNSKSIGRKAH